MPRKKKETEEKEEKKEIKPVKAFNDYGFNAVKKKASFTPSDYGVKM